MNIEETKLEVEKVNNLLITYEELDLKKIEETQEMFKEYYKLDVDLDESINYTYDKINGNIVKAYMLYEELDEFKESLLIKCEVDDILSLIAKTMQNKNIKLSNFQKRWLKKLKYFASEQCLNLDIPDEIIEKITDYFINYKIDNTHGNIEVTLYKIEKLLKNIFSWIWDNKLNFITIIICILLIIKYYYNTGILLISILGTLSAIGGSIIKPICW